MTSLNVTDNLGKLLLGSKIGLVMLNSSGEENTYLTIVALKPLGEHNLSIMHFKHHERSLSTKNLRIYEVVGEHSPSTSLIIITKQMKSTTTTFEILIYKTSLFTGECLLLA